MWIRSVFNNVIEAFAIYNGELYAGGAFTIVDLDTVNHIAKWIGGSYTSVCGNTTAITEQTQQNFSVQVIPNPVTTNAIFQITGSSGNKTLLIYDQLGREIWRKETDENQIEFSVEGLSAGMYFYRVEQKGEIQASGKLVVQ